MSKIRSKVLQENAVVPTRVSFVALPRFNMATLITMIEPLRIANYLASQML
jgi:transcriptional regulator GlxA family with amidase domain